MKRNAIFRIILWSLTIVVLVSILGCALTDWSLGSRRNSWNSSVEATHIPEPEETFHAISNDGKNTFQAADIEKLEIEWVAGQILVQTGSTDQITIQEDGVTDPKYAMVLAQSGSKLKVICCNDSVGKVDFNSAKELTKDLTITVPVDWNCDKLKIECAAATVEVNDLTVREVEFDGASGACEFDNCTVREMDIDTASGDVRFVGSLDILDCDAASASVSAILSNTPSRLDMDSMSGDLEITLPEDAGFTLSMDGMSMDFESDFETTRKNGNYVYGDGSCRIDVDALSGDVILRKG